MFDFSGKRATGPVIRLHPSDNVVVARVPVAIGTAVPGEGFVSRSLVPAGHKIAARDLRAGDPILKYNVCIGFAASDIPAGTYVHSHNTEFREFDRDYAHGRDYVPTPMLPEAGQAGTSPLTLSFRFARTETGSRLVLLCGIAEPPPGFTAAPPRHTTVPAEFLPYHCRI